MISLSWQAAFAFETNQSWPANWPATRDRPDSGWFSFNADDWEERPMASGCRLSFPALFRTRNA
jgi:hypothetical protein